MHGHPNTPEIRIPSVRHGWLVLLLAGAQLGAALGQTGPNATAGIAVDGPAFLRTWCPPVYPSDALRKKVEGRVTVRLVVDANGNVASARVLSSSDPELDAAALDTARRWNFTPALDAGIPV
ncbi:MAG: energy transducer TonB, partial [Opitutaceae bacterium]